MNFVPREPSLLFDRTSSQSDESKCVIGICPLPRSLSKAHFPLSVIELFIKIQWQILERYIDGGLYTNTPQSDMS